MKKLKIKVAAETAGKLLGSTRPAAPTPGEMTFTQTLPAPGAVLPGVEAGPVKYLLGRFSFLTFARGGIGGGILGMVGGLN